MRTVPVVLCIDVEPDERETDPFRPVDWTGFEAAFECMDALRPRLAQYTGAPVRISWFLRMDPQIEQTYGSASWAVERYPDVFAKLERAGDELGLHVHAWRWQPERSRWFVDNGDQAWVDHCLHMGFEAYRRAFGRPCRIFRFGDRWMNEATLATLAALGVHYDLTIEPGRKPRLSADVDARPSGGMPDYTDAPRWAYRPSRDNCLRSSGSRGHVLWEIPLTTRRDTGRWAGFKRAAQAAGIDLQRRHDADCLYLEAESDRFAAAFEEAARAWRRPHVATVVRSEAYADPRRRRCIEQNLGFMTAGRDAARLRFLGPKETIEALG